MGVLIVTTASVGAQRPNATVFRHDGMACGRCQERPDTVAWPISPTAAIENGREICRDVSTERSDQGRHVARCLVTLAQYHDGPYC